MRHPLAPLTLLLAAPVLAQPQYTMTVIGAPAPAPAGPISFPLALNNAGRVTGYAFASPGQTAITWNNGAFSPLSGLGAFDRSYGNAVNAAGRIAGAGYRLQGGAIVESHALKWTGGAMTDLGSLGGHTAAALSINDFDQVVGYSTTPGETETRAFLQQNGAMTALPSLPGAVETIAYDISNTGYIAGAAVTSTPAHPVLWHNGSVSSLRIPTLSRTGAANAVNNAGLAVGTYELNMNTGAFAAAMWTSGILSNLGNLGAYPPYAVAFDVNNATQVVGNSMSPSGMAGFLWQSGRMFDLSTLVVGAPGVRITAASAINDRGQIAAAALIAGRETAVLLTPVTFAPAPGAIPVLAAAGLVALRRRR
jgi:probable HAF family extracellular repeat protein